MVLALSWALMPRPHLWKPFILAASYLFYAAASPRYALLLGAITLANQLGAVLVARTWEERSRTWIMIATVAVDLAALGLFKYYGFFAGEIGSFLDSIGLAMPLPLLTLALPIGLSFITFQAISYVVDVKRGLLEPATTLDFGLYLSFFPHVVAGPIVRAREFIPQLATPRNPRDVAVGAGVVLIAIGLVKKVALADYLAREVVDPVFGVPEAYAAPDVALAAYAYAAQIYCDFSGYTDIAIGCALLLGFRFPENFNRPYTAVSLQDFWRRWHLTLSRWLRDYLYIPLGGNSGSARRTERNLLITMLLGGLWHGAAWTFVVWGAIHGLGLALGRRRARILGESTRPAWARRLITFHIVCLAWVFFRADSFSAAGTLLWRLVTAWGPAPLVTPAVVMVIAGALAVQFLPEQTAPRLQARFSRMAPTVQGVALAVSLLVIDALGPQGVAPFIYFQF